MSPSVARYADIARQYWPALALVGSGAALYGYGRRSSRLETPSEEVARIRTTDMRNLEAIRVAPRAFLMATIALVAQVPRLLTEPRAAWRNVRAIVAALSDEQADRAGAYVAASSAVKSPQIPEVRDCGDRATPEQGDAANGSSAQTRGDFAERVVPMPRRPATSGSGPPSESLGCVQHFPAPAEFGNVKVRRQWDGIDGDSAPQRSRHDAHPRTRSTGR